MSPVIPFGTSTMDVTILVSILLVVIASISSVRPNEDSVDPEVLERVNNMRMEERREQFESLDENGDGKLSAQDYLTSSSYRVPGQNDQTLEEKLWKVNWEISRSDADGDNELSLREFSQVRTKDESEALFRRLFKVFDTDDNDIWSQNEMRELYEKQGYAESDVGRYIVRDLNAMDNDKDGAVSVQEFIGPYLEREEERIRSRLARFYHP